MSLKTHLNNIAFGGKALSVSSLIYGLHSSNLRLRKSFIKSNWQYHSLPCHQLSLALCLSQTHWHLLTWDIVFQGTELLPGLPTPLLLLLPLTVSEQPLTGAAASRQNVEFQACSPLAGITPVSGDGPRVGSGLHPPCSQPRSNNKCSSHSAGPGWHCQAGST